MMKFFCYGFITSILLASATEAFATILMTKSSVPGYIMQELALYTTCTLDDKGLLIIKNQLNGLTAKKTTVLQVDIKNMKNAIAEVFLSKIKRPDTIDNKDRPTTTYVAYQKQQSGKLKKVLVWQDNGVPAENIYNESPAALTLRKFMDTICK